LWCQRTQGENAAMRTRMRTDLDDADVVHVEGEVAFRLGLDACLGHKIGKELLVPGRARQKQKVKNSAISSARDVHISSESPLQLHSGWDHTHDTRWRLSVFKL
jgi:hypothetical protein